MADALEACHCNIAERRFKRKIVQLDRDPVSTKIKRKD